MGTWDEQLAEELNALDEEMNYELQRRNWSRNLFFGVPWFEIRKELKRFKMENYGFGPRRTANKYLETWLRGTI